MWAGHETKKRRFFLKEQLSAVYITQPLFTGIGLEFVVRHPGGVDLTVTIFFVKYVLKSLALYAGSNEARASVCLMMKNVLVFNFSCNSNFVDNVPSYSIRKFYQQIGLDLAALLFCLWTKQTHKLVCVFSSPCGH